MEGGGGVGQVLKRRDRGSRNGDLDESCTPRAYKGASNEVAIDDRLLHRLQGHACNLQQAPAMPVLESDKHHRDKHRCVACLHLKQDLARTTCWQMTSNFAHIQPSTDITVFQEQAILLDLGNNTSC